MRNYSCFIFLIICLSACCSTLEAREQRIELNFYAQNQMFYDGDFIPIKKEIMAQHPGINIQKLRLKENRFGFEAEITASYRKWLV